MSNPFARLLARTMALSNARPSMVQTIASFAIKLFGAALSFGFSLLIARLYGATGTGFFALAMTTATVAATVSLVGLDYLLLRSVSRDLKLGKVSEVRGQIATSAKTVLVFSAAAAALVAIAAAAPTSLISTVNLDPAVLGLAALGIVPLALGRIALGALRGTGRPITAQWIDGPLAMSITFSTVLLMATLGFSQYIGAQGAFAVHLASVTLVASLGWVLIRNIARSWPAKASVRAPALIKQSWRLSAIVLGTMIADWLLLLLINQSASAADVGQFRVAWQMVTLVTMVLVTFETVAGPKISAAYSINDMTRIRRIYSQSVKGMLALSAPVFVLIFAFPEWLLGLFGPEFVGASTALRILAFGQLINLATGPLGAVIIMTGNERWLLRMAGWSLALILAMGLLLIPAYGIVGAAIASSANVIFRNIFSFFVVRRVVFNPARQP